MTKKIILYSLFILSTFICSLSYSATLENLGLLKDKLIKYHDSGEYNKAIANVVDKAKTYLDNAIIANNKLKHPKKLAMVLDIDETSLSNYQNLKKLNFGGTETQIIKAVFSDNDPAIKPTLELFNYAKAHNVAVFFVTGRIERYRAETIDNLTKAGFKNWNGLILKPNNYDKKSVISYKSQARKNIEKQGYDIVLNMGDQMSDLKGGYADKDFKLPDPYYYLP